MTDSALTADGRARVLADGNRMPLLGLGVWQVRSGPECVNAVRWALELGYRHIDTAQAYGNEESVGTALQASGVSRDDVFVTTKFFPRNRDPVAAIEQSLPAARRPRGSVHRALAGGGCHLGMARDGAGPRAGLRTLGGSLQLQRHPTG